MKKNLLVKNTRNLFLTGCLAAMSFAQGQEEIIYQQNFDGNNGTFTNTIVSQNTPTNGWIASSTDVQYGDVYRHMWNFSDVTAGGNPETMPISGRSLGMGFYEGNDPFVPNQYFHYWAGEPTTDPAFYTIRYAMVGFSTEGYENITVEFKWRCVGEIFDGIIYDYGSVHTSIDGGSTWLMDQSAGLGGQTSEQGAFAQGLYYDNAGVQTAVLTLPANRANLPELRLGFRMIIDEGYGSGGGFIVDDIIVRGTVIEELGTKDLNKAAVNVYKDGADFVAKSSVNNIQNVQVFDLSGKMVMDTQTNAKEFRIKGNQLAKGVYVVHTTLENGEVLTQKIVK